MTMYEQENIFSKYWILGFKASTDYMSTIRLSYRNSTDS